MKKSAAAAATYDDGFICPSYMAPLDAIYALGRRLFLYPGVYLRFYHAPPRVKLKGVWEGFLFGMKSSSIKLRVKECKRSESWDARGK